MEYTIKLPNRPDRLALTYEEIIFLHFNQDYIKQRVMNSFIPDAYSPDEVISLIILTKRQAPTVNIDSIMNLVAKHSLRMLTLTN